MSIGNIAARINRVSAQTSEFINSVNTAFLSARTARGISGFEFDIPDTETLQLSSDITDHYTESNSFINDNVVNKPIMITLSGFIGELVYTYPEGLPAALQDLDSKLGIVDAYLGDYSPQYLQQAREIVSGTADFINKASRAVDTFQNIASIATSPYSVQRTKQQKAYQTLKAFWSTKEIVTVQTPWDYYENMIIKDIAFTQESDSDGMSDIRVTLKEIRFADVQYTVFDESIFPPRVDIQSAAESNQGIVRGENSDSEFSSLIFKALGGLR